MAPLENKNSTAPKQSGSNDPPFLGFQPLESNYIYCPNQFLDVCLPHSSRGVLRLVAYILRKTLGYLDENGNPVEEDVAVSYLDLTKHAGISTRAIPKAIDEALAAGFISCVRQGRRDVKGQRGQSAALRLRWSNRSSYATKPELFDGFYAGEGHRSPIPNAFFDRIVRHERLAVVKVVGTVLRYTVGYQNQFGGRRLKAPLSYSFIQTFANLKHRPTLADALRESVKRGYIRCAGYGCFDPNGGKDSRPVTYMVKWLEKANTETSTAKTELRQARHGKNRTGSTAKTEPSKDGKNRTVIKTKGNEILKQQHVPVVAAHCEAVLLLVEFGFDTETAKKLAENRGLPEVQQQIAWLGERNPRDNKLGMLRKAIEQNWSRPVTVEQAEKRLRHSENARQQARQQEIDDARVFEEKREKKRSRNAAQLVFNDLAAKERTVIEQTAFEQLNSDFFRKRFRTNEKFRLERSVDEICRQKETAPASPSLITY